MCVDFPGIDHCCKVMLRMFTILNAMVENGGKRKPGRNRTRPLMCIWKKVVRLVECGGYKPSFGHSTSQARRIQSKPGVHGKRGKSIRRGTAQPGSNWNVMRRNGDGCETTAARTPIIMLRKRSAHRSFMGLPVWRVAHLAEAEIQSKAKLDAALAAQEAALSGQR